MIVVVTGTNRRNSGTLKFSEFIIDRIRKNGFDEVVHINLCEIPLIAYENETYDEAGQSTLIAQIQDKLILPARKFWFVFPEYNGSYPGVLKLFLDTLSVRSYKKSFQQKKACLTGISSGRAGNLRGMEHLTAILNHLGVIVMPNQLPVSSMEQLLDVEGEIFDPETKRMIEDQVREFIKF